MKPLRNSVAVLSIAALLGAFAAEARADTTVIGNLPTCKTMLENCLKFSKRATMAAGPGGTAPDNLSQSACHRMHRDAEDSGTWPANPPFGFAEACTTQAELGTNHLRHHHFGAGDSQNAQPVPDPAMLPTTPPTPSPTP
jgi:hypothetical protein